jgi:hypothetical protein
VKIKKTNEGKFAGEVILYGIIQKERWRKNE